MRHFMFFWAIVLLAAPATAQKSWNLTVQHAPSITLPLGRMLNAVPAYSAQTGLLVEHYFHPNFGLGTGLQWALIQREFYTGGGIPNDDLTLNYLRLPLVGTYQTDPTQPIGFFGRVGVHLDYLLPSQASTYLFGEPGAVYRFAPAPAEWHEPYQRWVFGASLEAGMRVRLAKALDLLVSARAGLSLSTLKDESPSHMMDIWPPSFPSEFYPSTAFAPDHHLMLGINIGLRYQLAG